LRAGPSANKSCRSVTDWRRLGVPGAAYFLSSPGL
jgi:hypothetical protein